jgi:hypothetical protein
MLMGFRLGQFQEALKHHHMHLQIAMDIQDRVSYENEGE